MLTDIQAILDAYGIADALGLIYYRCLDCLSSFTSKENPVQCACGGKLEVMGKVVKWNTYEHEKEVCVCDTRCTHAQGPKCDCGCGGKNHGLGRLVKTVIKEGRVVIREVDQDALDRASEWRMVLGKATQVLNTYKTVTEFALSEYRAHGGYGKPYEEYWAAQSAEFKAKTAFGKLILKVHVTRMQRANDFIKTFAKV